jgi:hypothetical protein
MPIFGHNASGRFYQEMFVNTKPCRPRPPPPATKHSTAQGKRFLAAPQLWDQHTNSQPGHFIWSLTHHEF